MADVWVAVRRGGFGFRQHFAVKTIRAEFGASAAFRAMFLDEARLASLIHHTNVVPVLDLGEEDGVVYQVMPLVDGGSVAAMIHALRDTGAVLPLEVAVHIGIDAARGLHAAHEAKDETGRRLDLVHRDVSPHNLLVGKDGTAKVSDFGIAKAMGTASEATSSGDVKGKRAYLAPEQLCKEAVDRRADLFALGVVLWEMVAGRRLFETGDSAMFFSLGGRILDVRELRPSVPEALASVIARATQAKPDDRFPTSDALADALEGAARASGLTPSAKDVGRLVEQLLGANVAALERDLADKTAKVDAIVETTHAAIVERVRPRKSRSLPTAAAAALLAVISLGALLLAKRDPETAVPAGGPAAVSATASEAQPTPSNALALASAPPGAPLTSLSASVSLPTSARSAPPVTKPRSTPQPKFSSNPYAR